MITISIDLRKIDQSRCKKMTLRSGEAATFCDLILIETPNGEYGDYMIKQDTTKEEREAKVQMPILGNGKIRGAGARTQSAPPSRPQNRPAPPAKRPPADPDLDAPEDDIPF